MPPPSDMEPQLASSSVEVVADSRMKRQSRTREMVQGPSQPAISPTSPPTTIVSRARSPSSVAASSPRTGLRPNTAEPGVLLRWGTLQSATNRHRPGASASAPDQSQHSSLSSPSSSSATHEALLHLSQPGSPTGVTDGATSWRQGMVFNEDPDEVNRSETRGATLATSPSQPISQLRQQQQHNPGGGSGAGARPRTRTLDASTSLQRHTPVPVDQQRHRVGSMSLSASQPLLGGEQRSLSKAALAADVAGGRLHEPPLLLSPFAPSKSSTRDKRPGKRLLKRQASRPTSPVQAPPPSVDSLPLPIGTREPTKLMMLMKTLGGRMRGDIDYQAQDGDGSWHRGVAYIDDERGCLMFHSGPGGPFFRTLIPDLRGCVVLPPAECSDNGGGLLELIASSPKAALRLRPAAAGDWNLWLAALLCWQQTRATSAGKSPVAGASEHDGGGGNNSPASITGPANGKTGTTTEGSKTATIIKVGTIMLWDKGPTGSANDLVRRSSTRDSLSPGASWRQVSSILQENGELKLLVENEISSFCVIQLSQLSRCAIQQLDHTVLDEEFCLAIFPIYAGAATHLSIFRPVYLALDNRVQFEVWFVLLRAFAMPELYKLNAHDSPSIREVEAADLEDAERSSGLEMFRIEKTIGVRVTEAKVKTCPTGLEAHQLQHQHQQYQPAPPSSPQPGPPQHYAAERHAAAAKAESDPLVGNYVAEVILDGEVRARTTTKMATKTPYWREDCEFSDLPHTVQQVSVVLRRVEGCLDVVSSPGSESRGGWGSCDASLHQEHLFGTVHVALDKLQRDSDHEDWLQIMDDRQQPIGSMLIKVSHAEQVALLSKEYEPLSETLHRFPTGLTTMISASLPGHLRRLSEIFLNIFQATGNAGEWLMALVEDEIDGIGSQTSMKKFRFSSGRLKSNESMESASERELLVRDISKSLAGEANLLFRGNTLLTQSLEFHMRRLGVEYLEVVLQGKINEINEKNPDCEVDTTRLPHGGHIDIDQRWNCLVQHTTEVWRCIAESAHSLPGELRHILKYIRAVAEDRYGDFLRTVTYTAVSGFLFLRFICPAILSPKLFGLLRDHPRPRAQRTLTLIAKVLQKMSNMSAFGKREEWMEPMNRFLKMQRPVFRDYIDQVCGISAERGGIRSVPAAYGTPLAMLGRLGPTAKEGFPSLPYLIDRAKSLASLVRLWVDAAPEDVKNGHADGELLIFNDLCLGLQRRADACLAQVERARAADAASHGAADQLAESLEQATLIESLSVPPSLPLILADGDRPPGRSGSDGGTDQGLLRRRSREWRLGRDGGVDGRKASSGMGSVTRSKNGKVGRTILNGIMRIGGRAESPEAKSQQR